MCMQNVRTFAAKNLHQSPNHARVRSEPFPEKDRPNTCSHQVGLQPFTRGGEETDDAAIELLAVQIPCEVNEHSLGAARAECRSNLDYLELPHGSDPVATGTRRLGVLTVR